MSDWDEIDISSILTWLRIALELGILVCGILAVSTAWGTVWAVGLLILYAIGFVSH